MKKLIALSLGVLLLLAGGCKPANDAGVSLGAAENAITVSAYDYMHYGRHLEAAAKKFMAQNPGTTVNVNVFSSMPEIKTTSSDDGGMTVAMISNDENPDAESDYLRRLNTEMMSGGGADIIAMDIVPYYKYADAGQLLDLADFMDKDESFNRADYFDTVLDAMRYKGGQYILPLDFSFSYVTYDTELLTAAQAAEAAAKNKLSYADLLALGGAGFAAKEDLTLLSENPAQLFSNLFAMNRDSFINLENKTCDFTSGAFAQLLADVQAYKDAGYLRPMPVISTDGSSDGMFSSIDIEALRKGSGAQTYFNTGNSLMLLMNHFNTTQDGFMAFSIGGPSTVNHELSGLLADENGLVEVDYMEAFGINANTKNPELAWKFIKFLLAEEQQLSMYISGTPVHRNAAEESAKQTIVMMSGSAGAATTSHRFIGEGETMEGESGAPEIIPGDTLGGTPVGGDAGGDTTGGSVFGGGSFTVSGGAGAIRLDGGDEAPFVPAVLTAEQTEVFERYMAKMNAYISGLSKHTPTELSLTAAVEAEAERFFNGGATAQDIAQALQSRIGLILSEQ